MKKALLTSLLIALALLSSAAQSVTRPAPDAPEQPPAPSQADLLKAMPPLSQQKLDALIRFQTATASRVLGIDFTVDGVLPRIGRTHHPLHLINPFAPAEYGYGEEIASFNPRTGQPEGIVLWGIKF
jgi:hypothetical protein